MQDLYKELIQLLEQDPALIIEDKLNKALIIDRALKLNTSLLKLLLSNPTIKNQFFADLDGVLVFDKIAFQRFVNSKKFLEDSYTQYKNKIGLSTDNEYYLTDSKEVVLIWPHKDCILEGGQTKEDVKEKRNEIFYNTTLAPDDIDTLIAPKTLTNWKKYGKDGESIPKKISKQDNLIIKGNNLLALHSLKEVYKEQVKLIYIDPPYNTGNDSFGYNDNFNHSTWLTFMKNRLEVAKELLSNDGTICISIDNNELSYMQVLCDEVFCGNEDKLNKKNIITVKRSSVSGAKVINRGVVNVTEFLAVYSKRHSQWNPNRVFRKKERDDRYSSFITNVDENYENWEFSTVLDAFALEEGIEKSKLKKTLKLDYDKKLEDFYYANSKRIFRFVALDDNAVSDKVVQLKKISRDDPNKVYLLEREDKANYYLYKGQAILFFEERLVEVDGEKVFAELLTDIWDDVLPNDLHNEGGVSLKKGKKPEKFIQRILQLFSNPNDIVLDYHLGSGTTCAVAHKLNRRYIGIEQLNYEENDSVVRVNNVIRGEQSGISKAVNWQGGGNFIYAELFKSNQQYIEDIEKAKNNNDLKIIWEQMQETAFLSYKVLPQNINKEIKEFEALSFEDQQKFLIEVLDKNLLYVNKSEINDVSHKVSEYDKEMNQLFYSM